jgi:hypothetical protein
LFAALLWTALARLVVPLTQWDEPPLQPSDEDNSVMKSNNYNIRHVYRKKLENACQNLPPGLFYGSEWARNFKQECGINKNECRNAVSSETAVGKTRHRKLDFLLFQLK